MNLLRILWHAFRLRFGAEDGHLDAAAALGALRDPRAGPFVLRALESLKPSAGGFLFARHTGPVRARLILALGESGNADATPWIVAETRQRLACDSAGFVESIRALVMLGGASEVLVEVLRHNAKTAHTWREIRGEAALALAAVPDAAPALAEALGTDVGDAAEEALARMGGPAAIGAVAPLLDHWRAGARAIRLLERLGWEPDPAGRVRLAVARRDVGASVAAGRADPRALAELATPDDLVRLKWLLPVLGQVSDPQVTAALKLLLKSAPKDVLSLVVRALGGHAAADWNRVASALLDALERPETATVAAEELARSSPPELARLIHQRLRGTLSDEAALALLGLLRGADAEAAVRGLSLGLASRSGRVRDAARAALRPYVAHGLPAPVRALATHADPRVRQAVISLAAEQAPHESAGLIEAALRDPDGAVRAAALAGTRNLGPAAVSTLLADPAAGVRWQALRLIAADAVGEAAPFLDDPAPEVRYEALRVLTDAKWTPGSPAEEVALALARGDTAALARHAELALPRLVALLADPSRRVPALRALAVLPLAPAAEDVVSFATDPGSRNEALAVLGRPDVAWTAGALRTLVAGLADPRRRAELLRVVTACPAGLLDDDAVATAIAPCLLDGARDTRRLAASCFANGARVAPLAIAIAREEAPAILADPLGALPLLRALMQDGDGPTRKWLATLRRQAGEALAVLDLHDPEVPIRRRIELAGARGFSPATDLERTLRNFAHGSVWGPLPAEMNDVLREEVDRVGPEAQLDFAAAVLRHNADRLSVGQLRRFAALEDTPHFRNRACEGFPQDLVRDGEVDNGHIRQMARQELQRRGHF